MCQIIVSNNHQFSEDGLLSSLYNRNKDGIGFLEYGVDKEPIKVIPKDFDEAKAWVEANVVGKAGVMHWRMRTDGAIDLERVHPYKVGDHGWLFHNGVLSGYRTRGQDKRSDTQNFAEEFLVKLFDELGAETVIASPMLLKLLNKHVDSNRLIFVRGDDHWILNESNWKSITRADGQNDLFANTYAMNTDCWPDQFPKYTPPVHHGNWHNGGYSGGHGGYSGGHTYVWDSASNSMVRKDLLDKKEDEKKDGPKVDANNTNVRPIATSKDRRIILEAMIKADLFKRKHMQEWNNIVKRVLPDVLHEDLVVLIDHYEPKFLATVHKHFLNRNRAALIDYINLNIKDYLDRSVEKAEGDKAAQQEPAVTPPLQLSLTDATVPEQSAIPGAVHQSHLGHLGAGTHSLTDDELNDLNAQYFGYY